MIPDVIEQKQYKCAKCGVKCSFVHRLQFVQGVDDMMWFTPYCDKCRKENNITYNQMFKKIFPESRLPKTVRLSAKMDLAKLEKAIEYFESENIEYACIYANEITLKAMANQLGVDMPPIKEYENEQGDYLGCKLFIDNDLEFGEFVLR